MLDGRFAQLDEGAHDVDAHLHRLGRRQHVGGLDGAVFGEGVGQGLGIPELGEVVAICDHLCFLGDCQLEQKVGRESVGVAALRRLAQKPEPPP